MFDFLGKTFVPAKDANEYIGEIASEYGSFLAGQDHPYASSGVYIHDLYFARAGVKRSDLIGQKNLRHVEKKLVDPFTNL